MDSHNLAKHILELVYQTVLVHLVEQCRSPWNALTRNTSNILTRREKAGPMIWGSTAAIYEQPRVNVRQGQEEKRSDVARIESR